MTYIVRKEDEEIFRHWKAIIYREKDRALSVREASKMVSDEIGITVGEGRLRDIIKALGTSSMRKTIAVYAPENSEDDYTWVIEWSKRFAKEFKLNPKRVRFIVDRCVVWARKTKYINTRW